MGGCLLRFFGCRKGGGGGGFFSWACPSCLAGPTSGWGGGGGVGGGGVGGGVFWGGGGGGGGVRLLHGLVVLDLRGLRVDGLGGGGQWSTKVIPYLKNTLCIC